MDLDRRVAEHVEYVSDEQFLTAAGLAGLTEDATEMFFGAANGAAQPNSTLAKIASRMA